jgi:plastocyanin
MSATRVAVVVAALGCVAAASCADSQATPDRPPAITHTVVMEGMAFTPRVISVAAGDTIVWVNKDMVPHSATSTTAGFDSKVVAASESWRTRIEHTGEFDYVCSFHPMMTAKVVVR